MSTEDLLEREVRDAASRLPDAPPRWERVIAVSRRRRRRQFLRLALTGLWIAICVAGPALIFKGAVDPDFRPSVSFPTARSTQIEAAAVSADGRVVAAATSKRLSIRDARTGGTVLSLPAARDLAGLSLSAHGDVVAVAYARGRIELFRRLTPTISQRFIASALVRARRIEVSPDGGDVAWLAGGGNVGLLRISPRGAVAPLQRLPVQFVTALKFTGDSSSLLTADVTGKLTLWRKRGRSYRAIRRIQIGASPIQALATAAAPRAAVLDRDGLVRVVDLQTGGVIARRPSLGGDTTLAMDPSGTLLASASDNKIEILDLESGREKHIRAHADVETLVLPAGREALTAVLKNGEILRLTLPLP